MKRKTAKEEEGRRERRRKKRRRKLEGETGSGSEARRHRVRD